MGQPRIPDAEFIELCNRVKSPTRAAEILTTTYRSILARMSRLEAKGVRFEVSDKRSHRYIPDTNPGRLNKEVKNGVVLVGSDAHYFPDTITRAHLAFVKLCRELKPSVVVMNGDVFDGATISRWPRIGWDNKPTVKQELDTCTQRLLEITDAAKGAAYIWPLGNHDARFETFLAAHASEYEGVKGFHLKDKGFIYITTCLIVNGYFHSYLGT